MAVIAKQAVRLLAACLLGWGVVQGAVVRTAPQFVDALSDGGDVLVRAHLDLTTQLHNVTVPPGVLSIRGCCTAPPADGFAGVPAPAPLACVLRLAAPLLVSRSLWLDRLALEAAAPLLSAGESVLRLSATDRRADGLWMTNVTVAAAQASQASSFGCLVSVGRLLAHDCTFFGIRIPVASASEPVNAVRAIALTNSTVASSTARTAGLVLVTLASSDGLRLAGNRYLQAPAADLANATDATSAALVRSSRGRAQVYSDVEVVVSTPDGRVASGDLELASLWEEGVQTWFLVLDHPWLAARQAVATSDAQCPMVPTPGPPGPSPVAPGPPPPPPAPNGRPPIGALVAGGVAVLAVVAVALWWSLRSSAFHRWSKVQLQGHGEDDGLRVRIGPPHPGGPGTAEETGSQFTAADSLAPLSARSAAAGTTVSDAAAPDADRQPLETGSPTLDATCFYTRAGTLVTVLPSSVSVSAPAVPAGGGGPGGRGGTLDVLETMLDYLYDVHAPLLGGFTVRGSVQRRRGGQGLVQFADGPDGAEVVVKFFAKRSAFRQELELYGDERLQEFLPQLVQVDANDGGTNRIEANGFVFPPCIVVERGQSLNEWVSRVAPDRITALQMLLHVVDRVRQLHAVRLVHRDLKPGNILWLPRRGCWTLIDFGCVAEMGSEASLAFSLQYAPPEVLEASGAGQLSVKVEAAVDIWAMGIIAYELLTGRKLFACQRREDIIAQICGGRPLPWEAPKAESDPHIKQDRRALGKLGASVMECLARDPAARPTAEALHNAWHGVLRGSPTRT